MTANFAKLKIRYFTKTLRNLATEGGTNPPIEARIQTSFNSAFVDNAQDWIIAVERFEINLNGIPFFTGEIGEQIVVTRLTPPNMNIFYNVLVNFDAYSLPHFIQILNERAGSILTDIGNITFSINREGFISIGLAEMDNYSIVLPRSVNRVLGLQQSLFPTGGINEDNSSWTSIVPRWEMGDRLGHVRISSNLGVTSDTIDQARSNILTDVAIISGINASGAQGFQTAPGDNDFGYSQRQKLIYDPKQRRYLNILYPQPIIQMDLAAYYVFINDDGREEQFPILLFEGGEFSIKLGFYKRQ